MHDSCNRLKNLQRANNESHKIVQDSLREALYSLLKTKSIDKITVTELVNKAGVSRAVFYKHYYLVKDVFMDGLEDFASGVRQKMSDSLYENWLHILTVTYEKRESLLIALKADMGMDILRVFNKLMKPYYDEKRFLMWTGIIFNEVIFWAKKGFDQTPEELAKELTEITQPIFKIIRAPQNSI